MCQEHTLLPKHRIWLLKSVLTKYNLRSKVTSVPLQQLVLVFAASLTFHNCEQRQYGVKGHRSKISCQASGGGEVNYEWRFSGSILGVESGCKFLV